MGTSADRKRLYWRLAIGLLAATGAYAWFVTVQYGRLNELNQRELANAASELKRSLENAVETVTRFNPTSSKADARALCKFDADQPYLALDPPNICDRVAGPFASVEPTATAPLGIEAVDAKSGETVSFVFRTDALLRELSFPESFGLIFIARDDGTVLYQEAPSKRSWLRHLRWGEQQFRDSGAGRYGSLNLEQLDNVFGDDKVTGWPHLRSMSGRTSLRLGGTFHEVYLEPLVLENGQKLDLVIGGAVQTDLLVRQALAVDSYFLAFLVFLLLLALLGFPFVKLLSLDAHERFTLRDVTLLYMSTAALLALFTFATQAFDGYVRWHRVADSGLQQLAYRFEGDFIREVSTIHRQIDEYDQQLAAPTEDPIDDLPPSTDWYSTDNPDKELRLALPDESVHIEQVSWIGPNGRQIWKITADSIAAKNDVSTRVYFQSVRDGHLFEGDDTGDAFYVGPDRSVTDGKFYTFVAMPSRIKARHAKAGVGTVVTASTRLLSMNTPALPAGYGFAVINREGRVLYHSDQRLSLRENLFDELNQGARARAMVYATHEDSLTSAYRERPHEFYFHPIRLRLASDHSPAGLYMVAFRDTSLERAIVARVFLISLLGPMVVLLGFVGVSLVTIALVPVGRREHWSVWLWPHGGLVHAYKQISGALILVLVAGLLARSLGATDVVFAVMPILALASAVTIYAVSTRRKSPRCRLESKGWHSAMFVLFLLCAIVVPASALFRAALGHEFGKLIATEQEWMAAQRTDQPALTAAELRAENRPPEMGRRVARARAAGLTGEAPHPFDATPPTMPASTHWLLEPFHWADSLLPIENDYAARERYEERDYSYAPDVPWGPPFRLSAWGIVGFAATFALLAWWIRWEAIRLFFADQDAGSHSPATAAELWAECSRDERLVLVRIAHEHIANPFQRPIVEGLLKRGLLTLDPDLRPCSRAFADYIREREPEMEATLREWEEVESGHSWRYARLVLIASIVGLGLFVVVTQPGLQSGLVGVASAVAAALTAIMKLRDAIGGWLTSRKSTA